MKSLIRKGCLALLVFCSAATSTPAAGFLIHDGDRVVFLGDSITEQRLYTTYIEAYAVTRHPQWRLWFRNVGWGGDTSWLRQRSHPDEAKLFAADQTTQEQMVEKAVTHGLERDVLPLQPTFVTVDFGMNDHSYQAFREDIFQAYVRSQSEIARILESHGARVAFLTPQPIEDKRPDPDKDVRNQSLRRFSDGLREVAARQQATFVDEFDPYMAMLLRERPNKPDGYVGGGDAVHPGPIGHTVMAWAILKGLGATPLVARLNIDVSGNKASTEACLVQNLQVSGNTVTFEDQDQALPMPIDPRAEPALNLAPILQDLDVYELRITGLPAGNYELSIDGQSVGKTSSEELARGWNIANLPTPMTQQAQRILDLVFRKNNVYFDRWRNVQLYVFPEWARSPETDTRRAEELSRLDKQIADLQTQIALSQRLTPHHFEIKPAGQ